MKLPGSNGASRARAATQLTIALASAGVLAGCSEPRFEIEPAVVTGCALGHGHIVEVSWDASAAGAEKVRLGLLRPGQGEKVWGLHGPVGSKKTGRWASDGLTFVLYDQDDDELARRTLTTSACPRKQKYE
jgi:hypothetical protein